MAWLYSSSMLYFVLVQAFRAANCELNTGASKRKVALVDAAYLVLSDPRRRDRYPVGCARSRDPPVNRGRQESLQRIRTTQGVTRWYMYNRYELKWNMIQCVWSVGEGMRALLFVSMAQRKADVGQRDSPISRQRASLLATNPQSSPVSSAAPRPPRVPRSHPSCPPPPARAPRP